MFRNIENIDYDYLKIIEDNIKNGMDISYNDITYFLECLVYMTRVMVMDGSPYLEFKCDLAQSIICHYLNDLNVTNYPNVTLKAISSYTVGHSFVVATFKVEGRDVNYLLDPTYIQFFKGENCNASRFIYFNDIVIRTPDPGYFIMREDKTLIDEFNYNGFGILNEDLARAYGNSFYNARTMRKDIVFDELKGYVYINAFLKGNERLSKSMNDLINEGKYINLNGNKNRGRNL